MKTLMFKTYMYLQVLFISALLGIGYLGRHLGFKRFDLNKSLNYFGFGTSDSEPEPLNKDIKLKYEGKK